MLHKIYRALHSLANINTCVMFTRSKLINTWTLHRYRCTCMCKLWMSSSLLSSSYSCIPQLYEEELCTSQCSYTHLVDVPLIQNPILTPLSLSHVVATNIANDKMHLVSEITSNRKSTSRQT